MTEECPVCHKVVSFKSHNHNYAAISNQQKFAFFDLDVYQELYATSHKIPHRRKSSQMQRMRHGKPICVFVFIKQDFYI